MDRIAAIDVLCVGSATYDLVYAVEHHPGPDEKIRAASFAGCGGGPAANAAVTVARLGLQAAFVGYLGRDMFGAAHIAELQRAGVFTDRVARGAFPSAVSAVMVKPDGSRALVSHRNPESLLSPGALDFSGMKARVILFDGHEPSISPPLARYARSRGIATILDAGSVHRGTAELADLVDYLVCSERFGLDFTGEARAERALEKLASHAPNVIITRGEKGLLWKRGAESSRLPAYQVNTVDTTGAGDIFHGALAACLARKKAWRKSLAYASAAAALCCTKIGARPGIPSEEEVKNFLEEREKSLHSKS
ncbi:MAG: carbohydrate kinase [Deltaproteobacteria bacterium]|nr:carbohydrate kinase [Deltaproteobacteria bacterium]